MKGVKHKINLFAGVLYIISVALIVIVEVYIAVSIINGANGLEALGVGATFAGLIIFVDFVMIMISKLFVDW